MPVGDIPKVSAAGGNEIRLWKKSPAEHKETKMMTAEIKHEIQMKQFEFELALMAQKDEFAQKEHQRAMELEKAKMTNLELTKQNLELEIELEKMKMK